MLSLPSERRSLCFGESHKGAHTKQLSSIMLDLKLRRARPSDFYEVLEMSKGIYSGHDYLPSVFLKWLSDSNRAIFVAEVGGKAVGLRAIHIVDGGQTMISQALRIHPDFRGKALSSRLIDAVHEYVRLNHPSVCRERFTTKSDNVQRLAIQKKYGDKSILEQGILAFFVKAKDRMFSSEAGMIVGPCSKRRACELVLSVVAVNVLFPGKTLVIDWEPYEADASNVDDLFADGDAMFTDSESSARLPKSFSHGRPSPRAEHQHWVCTIYTDDPVLFRAHAARQLRAARETMAGDFIFSTFQNPNLNSDGREFLNQTLGLEAVDFFTFGLILFERYLPWKPRRVLSELFRFSLFFTPNSWSCNTLLLAIVSQINSDKKFARIVALKDKLILHVSQKCAWVSTVPWSQSEMCLFYGYSWESPEKIAPQIVQ